MRLAAVYPSFLWSREHELFMTSGTRFPVVGVSYKMVHDDLQGMSLGLIVGLEHTQPKPRLYLNMQPRPFHHSWMSRAVLDRGWPTTNPKESGSLSFVAKTNPAHGSRPCTILAGAIIEKETELSGQPIFRVNIGLTVILEPPTPSHIPANLTNASPVLPLHQQQARARYRAQNPAPDQYTPTNAQNPGFPSHCAPPPIPGNMPSYGQQNQNTYPNASPYGTHTAGHSQQSSFSTRNSNVPNYTPGSTTFTGTPTSTPGYINPPRTYNDTYSSSTDAPYNV